METAPADREKRAAESGSLVSEIVCILPTDRDRESKFSPIFHLSLAATHARRHARVGNHFLLFARVAPPARSINLDGIIRAFPPVIEASKDENSSPTVAGESVYCIFQWKSKRRAGV